MGWLWRSGKVYKPKEDVKLGPHSDEIYIHANVKAPRMAGFLVKLCVWILESRLIGWIVVYILKRDNLIHKLISSATINEPPLFVPSHKHEATDEAMESESSPPERVSQVIHCLPPTTEVSPVPTFKYKRWTIRDYCRAYLARDITPFEVAERFLAAVKRSMAPPLEMGFFINYNDEDILKQAAESTLRYNEGKPISVLDGVLIAVKDEIDCMPYPTTGGTKWLHKHRKCEQDAGCVQHLRSCGAILVGKTNMHELGAGTSGINPHYGVAKNPYDINKVTGGSSSGSAAMVCAGLCPAALGVDGGGSVRMPASLCGVVGLKPTFGRISHSGVLPFNWTVGMVGILAGTVEDACIVQAAISELVSVPPKLSLPFFNSVNGTSDIKLAKSAEWFDDCNEEIRKCCDEALSMLFDHYGGQTIDVTVPEIEEMRLAHYTTIGAECTTSLSPYLEKIKNAELGWDARVALRIYGSFSSKEYLNAQRLRNRQMHFHKEILKSVDAIVTPTTGVTAYPIHSDALKTGELDYINGAALVRYQISGNFLGLPAVTVPVGYDKLGMPIGLQFIGRPWSEATLLQLAHAMQELCKDRYRKPQVFYNLLEGNGKGMQ